MVPPGDMPTREVRDGLAASLRTVRALVERLGATETDNRTARRQALACVLGPRLPPEVPELAPRLRDQIGRLAELRRLQRWRELSVALAELEQLAAEALQRATALHPLITAPVARRDALRARLEHCRGQAGRHGFAGVTELTRRHSEAHALLWHIPCDLAEAAAAVGYYEHMVTALIGTGRH